MGLGWIKLYRELLDNTIWVNSSPEQRIILITLLLMANHKPNKWEWRGEVYEVQPGQFITSVQSVVERCRCESITRQKVRTALRRFANLGFLTIETTNKNSLITIVNWEKYQNLNINDNQQLTNAQPTLNQQLTNAQPTLNQCLTTNKNDKNDENVKNDKNDKNINSTKHKYGAYKNILLTDDEYNKLQEEFPDSYQNWIERVSNYVASTGKSYKNYLATIRNWAAKERAQPQQPTQFQPQPPQGTSNIFLQLLEKRQREGDIIDNG